MPFTSDTKTKRLVLTAMLTALTALATAFIKIPLPIGYIHVGDALVILAAILLPAGYACFAAGMGCALADIIAGYAMWAPYSFIAKAMMVLIISLSLKAKKSASTPHIPAIIGATLADVTIYYFAEVFMYGSRVMPLVGVPVNIFQAGIGFALAFAIRKALSKSNQYF